MTAPLNVPSSVTRQSNPWLVLGIFLLIYIFNYADRYLISGLVDPIKAEFGVGDQFMGLLMGPAFAVLYTTAGIPIARYADRSSRINIICIGCFVWSLFTGLSGFAVDEWTLALARVGVGVGEAAFVAPAYSMLADYFKPEKRGMAFATMGLAVYFGQMTGYAAGPAIAVGGNDAGRDQRQDQAGSLTEGAGLHPGSGGAGIKNGSLRSRFRLGSARPVRARKA